MSGPLTLGRSLTGTARTSSLASASKGIECQSAVGIDRGGLASISPGHRSLRPPLPRAVLASLPTADVRLVGAACGLTPSTLARNALPPPSQVNLVTIRQPLSEPASVEVHPPQCSEHPFELRRRLGKAQRPRPARRPLCPWTAAERPDQVPAESSPVAPRGR
jgi:hypothetical protein